jgi:putative two-component system response regulator
MSNSGLTILAIDDTGGSLISIKHILSGHYDLCVAKSAQRGFIILESTKIDLVLLDIEMPEMDGFGFIEVMRQNSRYKNIPVIFVTGNATKEVITKAIQAGVKDYVVKPVKADILLEKIKNALHPHQSILSSIARLEELCVAGKVEQANGLLADLKSELARIQITTEISITLDAVSALIARLDLVEAAQKLEKLQFLVREKLD